MEQGTAMLKSYICLPARCLRSVLFVCTVVAVNWLAEPSMAAQTANLTGHVKDTQGRPVEGVSIIVTSTTTPPVATTTDVTGHYRFPSLSAGIYTVTATMPGFQIALRQGVQVDPTAITTVDLELTVGGFTQQVDVIGVTPLSGTGVNPDHIPAIISVLSSTDIHDRHTVSLADALQEQFGAVRIDGTTSNLFQPTVRFRGFTASPLLGLPQGIAVYQNGVRINEPFGDTVQFDLIPQFALDRIQLSAGADPTYGLNALGGALGLTLKNGFDSVGFRGELSGGSFGRVSATTEWGANRGPWALYLGATRFDETGWRIESPSEVTQAVTDLAYRKDSVDAGVSLTYANSSLNGNGPAPIELLQVNRSAVFTYPDITENQVGFIQGRFNLQTSPAWSVQMTGYYRDFDSNTLNGDEAEFVICGADSLPTGAPLNTLCLGGDDDENDESSEIDNSDEQPLVTVQTGEFITQNETDGTGAFNRSQTQTTGYGGTIQATATTGENDRTNVLVLGLSADLANVDFVSNSEIGNLTDHRTVAGSGLFTGLFGTAPDDLFNTALDTNNRSIGLYFSDTLSVTERAHLTVSGRFNDAQVDIRDRLGTSLNGEHNFSRFNIGVGAVYETTDSVSVFGRYSEANRAPTAAELSCADPEEPCRVPNAFVSDPPLKQTVAHSMEAGVRGQSVHQSGGNLNWSLVLYRTEIDDDILFVASPKLIGTGFFQNAGDTRRFGLDLEFRGQTNRFTGFVSYGLVEAIFASPLELPGNSEVNDATNEERGSLAVEPGDRLPGIPRHSFKTGIGIAITTTWNIDLETIVSSSRVFVGDEGNDQASLDGYGIANLRSTYRFTQNLEMFVRIENIFDTDYSTFGILAELEVHMTEAPDAEDPRFLGPGAPRSGFAGIQVQF
jgi:iron complex outermembrane receptor protein